MILDGNTESRKKSRAQQAVKTWVNMTVSEYWLCHTVIIMPDRGKNVYRIKMKILI